jgi:hypothetical protein
LDLASLNLADGCYTLRQTESNGDGWDASGVLTVAEVGGGTLLVTATYSGAVGPSRDTTLAINTTCP